jgi:hypothetical protein
MLWQLVVPGNERQKEKVLTIPSAARQEQWKEIHRHFSGDHMFVRCTVSHSRYDNLHLADHDNGGNFSRWRLLRGSLPSSTRIRWLDAVAAFFHPGLQLGISDTTVGLGGLQKLCKDPTTVDTFRICSKILARVVWELNPRSSSMALEYCKH